MAQTYAFPTANTIVSQAIAEAIGSSASTLTALQTTALLQRLNFINQSFINAAHTDGQNGGWSWMDKQTNFQTVAETSLNGAITTASTSIILTDATSFDTAGRIWVKTTKGTIDFIDYTGKSSNTLTGCTNIDINHATAEIVGKCYALPTDYAKSKRLIVNYNQEYIYNRQEILPFYATYYDRGGYLVFPWGIGAQDVSLWYEKSPTKISNSTDGSTNQADLLLSLDIPTDFMWYAVNKLVSYILMTRKRQQEAPAYDQAADGILQNALTYDLFRTTPQGVTSDW